MTLFEKREVGLGLKDTEVPKRECNRHFDCDEADRKAREAGYPRAEHCHDECCEDCFGN